MQPTAGDLALVLALLIRAADPFGGKDLFPPGGTPFIMPISSRFVIQSTIVLLAIGFLTLLGIVGMTIWLNERAQAYFNEVIEARDTRTSAVELRSAMQTAESSQRGFIVTGNEIYLAPFDSAKALAKRQLDSLKQSLAPYLEPRSCFSDCRPSST
jgi:hypothetical protein